MRSEVVAQPHEADRVAVAAGADSGVGDELGHQVRTNSAKLQLPSGSPSRR